MAIPVYYDIYMEEKHVHKQADEILAALIRVSGDLNMIESEAERELEAVRSSYAVKLDPLRETVSILGKDLVKLMKTHKAEVFDGKDTVSLAHGILLYAREMIWVCRLVYLCLRKCSGNL